MMSWPDRVEEWACYSQLKWEIGSIVQKGANHEGIEPRLIGSDKLR